MNVLPHAQLKYMGKAYYSQWADEAKSEAFLPIAALLIPAECFPVNNMLNE